MSTWRPSACSSLARSPGTSLASSTTAPAPSPNSTQVVRSLKSRMREKTSEPITSALRRRAGADHRVGHASARRRSRSRPPARRRPGSHARRACCCTMQAVDGNTMSGVDVATMIRSIVAHVAVRGLQRRRAPLHARGRCSRRRASAKWRAWMPVRSTIQSSEVSMPSRASCVDQLRRCVTRSRRQEAAGAGDAREARSGLAVRRRGRCRSGCRLARPVAAARHGSQRGDDPVVDPVQQAVSRRIISPIQRLLEGEGIGRTVALEDQAAQAEQGRAVVAARVDARLEMVQHRQRHQRRQLGQHSCA